MVDVHLRLTDLIQTFASTPLDLFDHLQNETELLPGAKNNDLGQVLLGQALLDLKTSASGLLYDCVANVTIRNRYKNGHFETFAEAAFAQSAI